MCQEEPVTNFEVKKIKFNTIFDEQFVLVCLFLFGSIFWGKTFNTEIDSVNIFCYIIWNLIISIFFIFRYNILFLPVVIILGNITTFFIFYVF